MNMEFSVINLIEEIIYSFNDKPFTAVDVYLKCEKIFNGSYIFINMIEIKTAIEDLYDNFELDRKVSLDNIVYYQNSNLKKGISVSR